MIERPNPQELRPDYIPSEAIRLATFRQSELTREGRKPSFSETADELEAIEGICALPDQRGN